MNKNLSIHLETSNLSGVTVTVECEGFSVVEMWWSDEDFSIKQGGEKVTFQWNILNNGDYFKNYSYADFCDKHLSKWMEIECDTKLLPVTIAYNCMKMVVYVLKNFKEEAVDEVLDIFIKTVCEYN